MKLKNAIRTVEYSNLAIVMGLFIVVVSFVAKQKDGKVNIFLMVFALPFIFLFFFRKLLINSFLKQSKYPGVFYSVLDKMHLTENLEISLTDDLLDEIYKPSFTTLEFLEENNLKTEIGRHKFLFFKERKHQNDKDPIVRFDKTGFFERDFKITWADIYDWDYYQSSKDSNSLITIHYYNQDKTPTEHIIYIGELNTDKVELLMLLAHFRAKYGQNPTSYNGSSH